MQAMYSSEGERVQLIQNISTSEAKGAVEKWLLQVEDIMLRSVRDEVARSTVVSALFPVVLCFLFYIPKSFSGIVFQNIVIILCAGLW